MPLHFHQRIKTLLKDKSENDIDDYQTQQNYSRPSAKPAGKDTDMADFIHHEKATTPFFSSPGK